MKTKYILLLSVLMLLMTGMLSTASATEELNDEIKIIINNQPLITADPPTIIDGRTLVPLRAIAEAMGCDVTWVASTQTANLTNETTIVSMQIGNKLVGVRKRAGSSQPSYKEIDVPPMLINDRTYIPARAFAEALNSVVGWDNETRTVLIVYDTTLTHAGGYSLYRYAGSGERKHHDSALLTMSFVSPESIDIASDGTIYVTDSGRLRVIRDGKSETIDFEPSYISASMLRCYGDSVYILTNEFQDGTGMNYYGIVRLNGHSAEGLYITEAVYSKITDFGFSPDGTMYILQNNVGVGINYISKLDTSTGAIVHLKDVDAGVTCLAVDKNGNIFLGNSVKGSIYHLNTATNEMRLFAGVDGKTKFIDGPNPMFFEPRRLVYRDNSLYVLDYNIIRRIAVNDASLVIYAETIAGKVSVDSKPETVDGKASESMLAPSYLMEFALTNDGIVVTDPKWAMLRVITNDQN